MKRKVWKCSNGNLFANHITSELSEPGVGKDGAIFEEIEYTHNKENEGPVSDITQGIYFRSGRIEVVYKYRDIDQDDYDCVTSVSLEEWAQGLKELRTVGIHQISKDLILNIAENGIGLYFHDGINHRSVSTTLKCAIDDLFFPE